MLVNRQEQLEHRIIDATQMAGNDLAQFKANFGVNGKDFHKLFPDDLSDLRPNTINQRLSTGEIQNVVKRAFKSVDLDKVKFEFAVASITSGKGKSSQNFLNYDEEDKKNKVAKAFINPPSGSEGENISANELLIIIVPNFKNIVYESLWGPIIIAILFTLIIITAFYLTVRTMLRQKKLSEIKNDFINNMTHEFKTPISTIALAAEMAQENSASMMDSPKGSRLDRYLGIIREENKRLGTHVEKVLQMALLDKGHVKLKITPNNIHDLIGAALNGQSVQIEQKEGEVDLNFDAEDDVVAADEVHISNILNNLIDNAIKYSYERVTISFNYEQEPHGWQLTVADNGIGIPKAYQSSVFDRFFRVPTGDLHQVKGFGLGLAYVRQVVEKHGGSISLASEPGKGSAFVLKF